MIVIKELLYRRLIKWQVTPIILAEQQNSLSERETDSPVS